MTETSHDSRTAWTKHFVDELQLRHVDQKEIDTALESVREHLDDSGETPDDAFGDPREYAASLKPRPVTRDSGVRVPTRPLDSRSCPSSCSGSPSSDGSTTGQPPP